MLLWNKTPERVLARGYQRTRSYFYLVLSRIPPLQEGG